MVKNPKSFFEQNSAVEQQVYIKYSILEVNPFI